MIQQKEEQSHSGEPFISFTAWIYEGYSGSVAFIFLQVGSEDKLRCSLSGLGVIAFVLFTALCIPGGL